MFVCACKLGQQDAFSQVANIGYLVPNTKSPLSKVSDPFPHFFIFAPGYVFIYVL